MLSLSGPRGRLGQVTLVAAFLFVLASCASCFLFQKNYSILDSEADEPIEELAETICSDPKLMLISRISTVTRLTDYLEGLETENAKLVRCKDTHLAPLKRLKELLESGNSNVCGEEKVSLIEDYHVDFISTNKLDVQKREHELAPRLIRIFFMYYAREVCSICQKSLINNFEWDVNHQMEELERMLTSESGFLHQILNGLFAKFFGFYEVNGFDEIVLVWDVVEGSVLSNYNEGLGDYGIDELTGTPIKMLVKTKDSRAPMNLKQTCRAKFHPIYSKIILPLVRLANLGYLNTGSTFRRDLDELKSNDLIRRWYTITQLCETILPIQFFQDPSMEWGKMSLIGKEEADELAAARAAPVDSETPAKMDDVVEYEPTTNNMTSFEVLLTVANKEDQNLMEKIDTNARARDRAVLRALSKMAGEIKRSLKGYFTKIFLSINREQFPGSSEKYVEVDFGKRLSKSFENATEEELMKFEGGSAVSGSIRRAKGRKRKGDVDTQNALREEKLSYRHTRTLEEIFKGWGKTLEAYLPSRTSMIIALVIAIILLLFCISVSG